MAIPIKTVLTVSTKGFTIGMKGATKALSVFRSAAKGVGIVLTALAGIFTAVVLKQASAIDRLGKNAQKLGVGVKFLQELRFAGEQSGVSIETTDMAFQRFTRRLAEAKKGTGELLPALKQLGITQTDLRDLSTDEAFLLFADRLATVKDEGDKVALAFKAVDSEGVGLVNLIGDGSEKFRELAAEANQLGFILSQDAVDGVVQFNDDLNELIKIIDGVVKQVVAALAPAMRILVKQFKDFILEIAGTEDGFEKLAFMIKDNLLIAFDSFLGGLEKVLNFMSQLANGIVELGRSIPGLDLFPMDDDSAERYEQVSEAIKNVERQAKNFRMVGDLGFTPQGGFQQVINDIKTLGFETEVLQSLFDNLSKVDILSDVFGQTRTEDMKMFRDSLINALNLAEAVSPELLAEFLPFGKIDFTELRKKLTDQVGKGFTDGLDKGVKNPETEEDIKSFFQKLAESFANAIGSSILTLRQKLEAAGFGDFTKVLEDGLVKAAMSFEDALTNAIITGKGNFEDFREILRQTLARAFVAKFITGPIFDLFKAKGGPVKAGQPYVVGEEGPELFVPGASGTIVPNHKMPKQTNGGGMMGGAVINYNINAVDAASFQQLVARDPEFIYNVSRAGARRTPA